MVGTKLLVAAILAGLLLLFALQNLAEVELTFLVWTFQSRRFVVIAFSVVVGLAIGWMIGRMSRRHG